MIFSTVYFPKSTVHEFVPQKIPLIQILTGKILILIILFILPDLLNQDTLSWIMMVLFSIEFWISKNMARKLLHIAWYIDSSDGEDKWIFQATLNGPEKGYQIIFWYSFIFYGVLLIVLGGFSIYIIKYSLACSISFGTVCNLINFWAFTKILKLRNNGNLANMVAEVMGDKDLQVTVQLPLNFKKKKNQTK